MRMAMVLALIVTSLTSIAQEYSFNDISRRTRKNSGTIQDGNVIKGYFYFYFSEKVSRKENAYEIVILNENLEEKGSSRIVESKQTHLLEASYNGTSIVFKFYDTKQKTVSYRTMDEEGELSQKVTRECNKYEAQAYALSVSNGTQNINIQAVNDDLFVDIHNFKEKQYSYAVEGLSSDGEVLWTYEPSNEMKIETGSYLGSSEDQIWIQVAKSKGIMSKNYTFDLTGISTSGERAFRVPLQTSRYNLLAHSATYKKEKDEIVVLGEYYDIKDKSMKSDSKGLFIKVITPDGDEVSEDFISWSRDIGSMVDAENKRELSKYYVFFHDVIQTADGRILAIGEQYRKQVSAAGVAMNVLAASSGNVSTSAGMMEIKIGQVIVIEINENYELSSVDMHDKANNTVVLPEGYGTVSQHLLAKMLKAEGLFDFQFTQSNEDNSVVSFAYLDKEKVKGKMRKQTVLNFISYVKTEEEYTSDKVELESDAYDIWFMAAKPGHILIWEYYKKEKTVELRLEPINY